MIPVQPQPEPARFDEAVRQPGRRWLEENNIPFDQAPPVASDLPPLWRKTMKEPWEAYQGVCAYLCIYFEWSLGAQSTDHFIAKSSHAGQAYEWSNYRLCCLGINRRKHQYDDLLDPFAIQPDTFVLNLVSGEIQPNMTLPHLIQEKAWTTIDRLGLNDPYNKRMRAERYEDYLKGVPDWKLKKESPFIWYEARRQNLL